MTEREDRSTAVGLLGHPPTGRAYPILWHSNAPFSSTGYGAQTALFVPRLARLGHPISISAFYGLEGAPLRFGDIRVLPRYADPFGNDILELHAQHELGGMRLGLTIVLCDIWVMHSEVLAKLNVAAWVPVDHEPCQPPTVRTLKEGNCVPIAMSRFGQESLRKEGLDPLYVPHGIDTSVYRPIPRKKAREMVGLDDDRFVVGMVAANKDPLPRKSFTRVFEAFCEFRRDVPEALLYLHTDATSPWGLNLLEMIEAYELMDAVKICDQYRYALSFSPEHMAATYSAMDVLANPSMGEGFGIPILEAQACGTPVITTNVTAMPELTGAGWQVSGDPFWTRLGSWQFIPHADAIAQAMRDAYDSKGKLSKKAVAFAASYDANRITTEFWSPVLDELRERFPVLR